MTELLWSYYNKHKDKTFSYVLQKQTNEFGGDIVKEFFMRVYLRNILGSVGGKLNV